MPDELPVAPRIPYNRPESGGVLVATSEDGGTFLEATQQQKDDLAGENNNTWELPSGDIRGGYVALVLPPFDLAGYFGIRDDDRSERTAQYSLDTTNGGDGTWTDMPGWSAQGIVAKPNYRTELLVFDPVIEDVKGVRFGTTNTLVSRNTYLLLHVYGYLKGADRLELWHPTLDQRLDGDHFDLGNIARGGAAVDVDFRVKNLSGTLTANSVSLERYVDPDSDTGETTTVEGWHELAYDGGAFSGGPLSIGNLASGAISDVCTLRRELPADQLLGYWSGKLLADADSWS
jgi:hypothetical protein